MRDRPAVALMATWLSVCLVLAIGFAPAAQAREEAEQTLLLRQPGISDDHLVFVHGGDIWAAERDGANPRRLTSSPADERYPAISPDGAWVAYTANYAGSDDIHVISINGGQPRRLTYHPSPDHVRGWTPDGRVLFASTREVNHGRSAHLWSIGLEDGHPERVMDARYFDGDLSADGDRLAYLAFGPAYNALYGGTAGWRQHRGGTTPSIIIYDLEADSAETVPGERVNDLNPMWDGEDLYFLSDRDDVSLALYRANGTDEPEKLHSAAPWDIRWASAHEGRIAFEAGGRLYEYDVETGEAEEIVVRLAADLPQLAARWVDASDTIQHVAISPTAQRALFTARGEVFTAPLGDGSARNITNTADAREYTALWSPRGGDVAYISDADGVHRLRLSDQRGFQPPQVFELGGEEGAFYELKAWSPDARRIAYTDNHLNLYVIDLESGDSELVATQARRTQPDLAFSTDSRWLAYTVQQANFLSDVALYELETGETTLVTDGMVDAASPAFSRDGAYLYFAASTNTGPRQVGLNMSTQERPARFGIYAAVLRADGRSPLLPGLGDEAGPSTAARDDIGGEDEDAEDADNGDSDESGSDNGDANGASSDGGIDLEGIQDRIISLPIAERDYSDLVVARNGDLFYIERPAPGASNEPPGANGNGSDLKRFSFDTQRVTTPIRGVNAVRISQDGRTLLLDQGRRWATARVRGSMEADRIDTSGLRLQVEPAREWAHIFDEAWRMQAAYFYDAQLQGLDWAAVRERYEPLLDHVARREDLNDLIAEMIGELQAGHNRIGGGDTYSDTPVRAGLLGADIEMAAGRYRIARIYSGERWNPYLDSPLAAPGLGVEEGDYILAVNGRELTETDSIWAALLGMQGEQVTLLVNSDPRLSGAREVVVKPIADESSLRLWGWIEDNRRAVSEATDGRVGYVYLPNTAGAGYAFFNRLYYAQFDLEAVIFDERSNGGGQAANYITDILSPFHLSGWLDRDGLPYNTPAGAHYGPKLMMIDQDAGSGGDFLPYAFRRRDIGPLIGTRTWGGLIGISANPPLMDGGFMTVPFFRFYTPEGEWEIENEGVAPDIEAILDPILTNQGRDSQLERTIEEALDLLEDARPPVPLDAPDPPREPGL